MTLRLFLGLVLAGLALPALATAAEQVSFARQIAQILQTNCAPCHLTGDEPGGMRLYPSAAYGSIVGVKAQGNPALVRVAPGDPEASYLLHKVRGTHLDFGGVGVQMPFGQTPISKQDQDLIRQWIAQGAKNN